MSDLAIYPGCDVCQAMPNDPIELKLADNDYWVASLRASDQSLLGTSFITPKRHTPELDDLTPEEDASFVVIRNRIIKAIRASFEPITFNVSCLKNNAFRADPDNTPPEAAHVHWHVKPRYGTKPIEFAGESFTDPSPGRYLNSHEHKLVSAEVALKIAETIRSHI
ncbi:MAG: HIT domain-containing protein [Candidatus Saccharimonadales bacterium]